VIRESFIKTGQQKMKHEKGLIDAVSYKAAEKSSGRRSV
jgi:hypothetical protein